MTVVQGSFAAHDRTRDPQEQFAEMRQELVDSLHQTLSDAKHGWLFPTFLVKAIENKIWEHERKLINGSVPPMKLQEFVREKYPCGLGTSFEVVEKLIAGHPKAMLAWDQTTRGTHGRTNAPRDPDTGQFKPELDNIQDRFDGSAPTGTSAQAGIRRLEKAAADGDGNAMDLLQRVIDPDDKMSINGACVKMGWRKPVRTVVDTDDGMSDAVVRRMGPIDTIKQAWKRATREQREEVAAWIDDQMSPLKSTIFR